MIRTFKKGQVAKYVLVPQGFVMATPSTGNPEVVVTAGSGTEWPSESPAAAAPVSGRAPESPPEDYIDEEELLWV